MKKLDEQIGVEYDKADALSGRCDIPRDTLLGWKNEAAQLKTELDDYKKHFEPQMIQIRLHRQATAHQEKTYVVTGGDEPIKNCDTCEITGLRCPIRDNQNPTFPCVHWQPIPTGGNDENE